VTIKLIVPDLDAETLNADELDEFVEQIGRLAEYAKNKAMAMRCRRAGDVERALRAETRCDMIYELLPPEWRW
jgi:hypothetical protein